MSYHVRKAARRVRGARQRLPSLRTLDRQSLQDFGVRDHHNVQKPKSRCCSSADMHAAVARIGRRASHAA